MESYVFPGTALIPDLQLGPRRRGHAFSYAKEDMHNLLKAFIGFGMKTPRWGTESRLYAHRPAALPFEGTSTTVFSYRREFSFFFPPPSVPPRVERIVLEKSAITQRGRIFRPYMDACHLRYVHCSFSFFN